MSLAPSTSSKKKPFTLLLLEFLFLLSLSLFPFFRGGVNLWSFSLCVFFMGFVFLFYWLMRARGEDVLRTALDPWIALYVVFFLVSALTSKTPYLSWIECFKLISALCAFISVRAICRDRQHIYRLAEVLVLIGGLLSAIGLLQFLGGLPKDGWRHTQFISSTYGNHNHFAGLLNLLIPISLGLIVAERKQAKKALFLFLSALMGVAMIFTLSRGGLIAFAVSMVFMVAVLRKNKLISVGTMPLLIFIGLVGLMVLLFGTASIQQRVQNIQNMTVDEEMSLKVRLFVWQGTLSMIRHFFWVGSGPGTFGHLFLRFRPMEFSTQRSEYALNDFLQLWAECGVFAFLAIAALTAVFFSKGFRIIRQDDSRLRIGLGTGILAGMLGLLVHGLFNFNFHIPANWILSVVAAALLFSMDEDRFYAPKAARVFKILISAALAVLLCTSLYLMVSDYHLFSARQFLESGDKELALQEAEKSVQMQPWNAEAYYLRGFIRSSQDVEASVKDFNEAIKRNSFEPVYDMAMAHLLGPKFMKTDPVYLTDLYRKALQKDPNNHELVKRMTWEAFGREGSPEFREEMGKMLEAERSSLAGLVSGLEAYGLWQFHRKYNLKLLGLDPEAVTAKAPGDLWNRLPSATYTLDELTPVGKERLYQGEQIFRSGEFTREIVFNRPFVRLVLRAMATPADSIYPTLYVKIDGKIVDEIYVKSKVFKNYYTDLELVPGKHLLGLEYVNDLCVGTDLVQDRNVSIQKIYFLES